MKVPEIIKHPVESVKTSPLLATLGSASLILAGYNTAHTSTLNESNISMATIALNLVYGVGAFVSVNHASHKRVEIEEQIKTGGLSKDITDRIGMVSIYNDRIIKVAMRNSGHGSEYDHIFHGRLKGRSGNTCITPTKSTGATDSGSIS